jgi:predicted transcriptional regulator
MTASKRFEIAERRRMVALLMAHLPQQEIARLLEVSEATVSDDLAYLRGKLQEEALVDVEGMVRRELASLDLDDNWLAA